MKPIPISLQLWSVHQDYRADYAATIQTVAEIGFQAVEVPLDFGEVAAAAAAGIIQQNKLTVSGIHAGIDLFVNSPNEVIAAAKIFDTRHVVCPWVNPERYTTRASCEEVGMQLNGIGRLMREAGLIFSFHNHASEFLTIEDRSVFEWILDATEPRNVAAEPDIYWISYSGGSPESFISRIGARARLIHIKDGRDGHQTVIGKGIVNMSAVFEAAEATGATEWYVVEQEEFDGNRLDAIRDCFNQLKDWGKG